MTAEATGSGLPLPVRITSVQRPLPLPSPDQCQRGQLGTRRYPPDRAATSEPDLSPGACAPPSCPPCVPPEVSVLDPAQQGSPAGRCDLQPQAVCAGNPAGLPPPPPGAPTLFPASQKAPGKQDGHCIVPTHRPPRAGPWHACQPDTRTCAQPARGEQGSQGLFLVHAASGWASVYPLQRWGVRGAAPDRWLLPLPMWGCEQKAPLKWALGALPLLARNFPKTLCSLPPFQ